MSLLNELDLTENELRQASQPLRDRILEKYARLKGLDLLTATQAFRRDNRRLNDTARAVRKQQGLKMPDDPDDEIVLGDKYTQTGATLPVAIAMAVTGAAVAWGVSQTMKNAPPPPAVTQPADSEDTINRVTPGFGTPENVE